MCFNNWSEFTTTFTNFGCKALDQIRDSRSHKMAYISRIPSSTITNSFHIISLLQDITNLNSWYRYVHVINFGLNSKTAFHTTAAQIGLDVFGTNRKRVYEFLLVINSNFGPILHRFWDTATYWLKIAYFSYPSFIRRPRSLCSLWNFAVKLSVRKLRVMGLLCGEGCMILTSTVFDRTTRVIDGQTDGR